MKKFTAIFTAIIMLAALTSCGKTPSAEITPTVESSKENETENKEKKAIVAYFSRAGENYYVGNVEKGNTQFIAEKILNSVQADEFKIETVDPYPENYKECVEVASREKNENARPTLNAKVDNMDSYDVVFLGYPIWHGTMPMAVYTFLESYDFTDKIIVLFSTNEGSGLGSSVSDVKRIVPNANVSEYSFSCLGRNAVNSDKDVEKWLLNFDFINRK